MTTTLTQQVSYDGWLSPIHPVQFGVPPYLVDDCQLIVDSGLRQLRSAKATFSLSRKHTLALGIGVSLLRVWNSLPASLRQPDIEFEHIKRRICDFVFNAPGTS